MRKAAQYLAIFFIITQVDRVSGFIHLYQPADTLFYVLLSYGQGLGLAIGVYLSFFFVRQQKVKWAAFFGIIVFGGADLFFNEFALIRTVSAKALIEADSSFVWIPAEYLQVANQVVAIAYGVLPTLASAILGWIQGGVDKLNDGELKYTPIERVIRSLNKWFDNWTIRGAVQLEAIASRSGGNATSPSTSLPVIDGQVTPLATHKRWKNLTADDVAWITANGRGQVMARFGISDGAAGGWKRDLADGKRPWQSAKKLPENAVK